MAAFLVESYQLLSPDPAETSSVLLAQISSNEQPHVAVNLGNDAYFITGHVSGVRQTQRSRVV